MIGTPYDCSPRCMLCGTVGHSQQCMARGLWCRRGRVRRPCRTAGTPRACLARPYMQGIYVTIEVCPPAVAEEGRAIELCTVAHSSRTVWGCCCLQPDCGLQAQPAIPGHLSNHMTIECLTNAIQDVRLACRAKTRSDTAGAAWSMLAFQGIK